MALSAGRRLGTYEILAPIGAGAMGEVYRARDTKLGRDVAIKVLPEGLARDKERRARFEREARTVAALNHPNIVTVHAIDEVEGIHFITLELVRGKTLSALIPNRGFPSISSTTSRSSSSMWWPPPTMPASPTGTSSRTT